MSLSVTLDEQNFQEEFLQRGWTDGLPVVPPTPERVQAMLSTVADADPDVMIGFLPQRGVGVSLEKAATNAVMAGCAPEYFPIVVAALEAMFDSAYILHSALSSTSGPAICSIVSGPLAAEIGMNARHNVLGQGNRANATIGRALRLVAVNALGAKPGEADASTFGHPGKYTYCFAEDPPPAPWRPLSIRLGYSEHDTTVTVLPALAPQRITQTMSNSPERVLRTIASDIRSPAAFYRGAGSQGVIVLGPEHAGFCIGAGWTQAETLEFLVKESGVSVDELRRGGVHVEEIEELTPDENGMVFCLRSPDHITLATAGGEGAGWSVWIPGHSWMVPGFPPRRASRRVRPTGEPLPDCGPDGCIVPWVK